MLTEMAEMTWIFMCSQFSTPARAVEATLTTTPTLDHKIRPPKATTIHTPGQPMTPRYY
jgi:hypothetical protein